MLVLSTVVVAFWVVLTKKLLRGYSTITTTAFITIFGFITFFPAIPFVNLNVQHYHLETWSAILGLALSSSVIGHLLWNNGLKRVPSEQAGMFLSFEPIGGVLLSVLILGEQVTVSLVAALVLVCTAIVVATIQFKTVETVLPS